MGNLLLAIKIGVIIFWTLNVLRYVLYFIITPLYTLKRKRILSLSKHLSRNEIVNTFRLSILIPAWNEEVGIIDTLKSIEKCNYPNMEIIVINDGSVDNTEKLVLKYIKENKKRLRKKNITIKYIYKENGGKGSALNVGWKNSKGDLVVTMDADTVFDKDALVNCVRYFFDDEIDALAGNVRVANKRSLVGILQQMEYNFGFYLKRVHGYMMSEYIVGGAFGVFRHHLWEECGGFDERCKTEDIMFSTNLQSKGYKISYAEDAIAYTEGASSWKGLYKQRKRWKKGQIDTLIKYGKLLFSKEKKHNKFLTFFMLPFAVLGNIDLFLEPIFTGLGVYLIVKSGDISMFFGLFIIIFFVVVSSYIFNLSSKNKWIVLLSPILSILYYPFVLIDILAIYSSLKLLLTGKDVVWQKWKRKGVDNV